MKTYILDANIFLRFYLKDNEEQHEKAKKHFQAAKNNEEKLVLIPSVAFEVSYVLRKIYSFSREEAVEAILNFVRLPWIEVRDREFLLGALDRHRKDNIELVDSFLIEIAQGGGFEVLSFDKKLKASESG